MKNLQSLRLLLADKDKEIQRLNKMLDEKFMKENTLLVENGIICIKNKEIERLKKELTEEKKASIRMYNRYVEEKERIDKAIEYNKEVLTWHTNEEITDEIANENIRISKGEDKE